MLKKGHTEEQIMAALKQQEAGEKAAEICRKLGIRQATFYLWKRQYAAPGWGCSSCASYDSCGRGMAG